MSRSTRQTLAHQALLTSIEVRKRGGLDLVSPLDVYKLCESLDIIVRFVDYSMEGIYVCGSPPRIFLSALRPLARRTFTCGHELGHHVFGHGATVDELIDELHDGPTFQPNEFLVQAFAGFLLMPILGMRKAFAIRGWDPATATPEQLLTVACNFGVGFGTLVNHLAYGLETFPAARARKLLRVSLSDIRRDALGTASSAPLIIVDDHWLLSTLDTEVGSQILLPADTAAEGSVLATEADLPAGRLFRVTKPGIARVHSANAGLAIFVRASRTQYVGLSRFRHLEDVDNDDEDGGDDD